MKIYSILVIGIAFTSTVWAERKYKSHDYDFDDTDPLPVPIAKKTLVRKVIPNHHIHSRIVSKPKVNITVNHNYAHQGSSSSESKEKESSKQEEPEVMQAESTSTTTVATTTLPYDHCDHNLTYYTIGICEEYCGLQVPCKKVQRPAGCYCGTGYCRDHFDHCINENDVPKVKAREAPPHPSHHNHPPQVYTTPEALIFETTSGTTPGLKWQTDRTESTPEPYIEPITEPLIVFETTTEEPSTEPIVEEVPEETTTEEPSTMAPTTEPIVEEVPEETTTEEVTTTEEATTTEALTTTEEQTTTEVETTTEEPTTTVQASTTTEFVTEPPTNIQANPPRNNPGCPKFMDWLDCGTCEVPCSSPTANIICTRECKPEGCYCVREGYRLTKKGECVEEKDCARCDNTACQTTIRPGRCSGNETWFNPGICEEVCGVRSKCEVSKMKLAPGCYCPQGYAFNSAGKCVNKLDCSRGRNITTTTRSPFACRMNEEWLECGRCEGDCRTPDRVCRPGCQQEGCYCKQGYVRDDNLLCIRKSACPICVDHDDHGLMPAHNLFEKFRKYFNSFL